MLKIAKAKSMRVDPRQITINQNELFRDLGYKVDQQSDHLRQLGQKLVEEGYEKADLSCGFTIHPIDKMDPHANEIRIGQAIFKPGAIILKQLQQSSHLAIFVATAGSSITNWYNDYSEKGDIFSQFIADAIASHIVEKTAELVETEIAREAKASGYSITNRYSPGYCDWTVAEQQILFSLLPENFCGISLTESSLMLPIKSVSGIIGIGESVQKTEYQCAICTMENCFRRIRVPSTA